VSPTPALAPAAARAEVQKRERRLRYRYPINLEFEYQALNQGRDQLHGYGKTLNISRGEILFQANDLLPAHGPIELVVNWPFLRGGSGLKLVAGGRIVRSDTKGITVKSFATNSAQGRFAPRERPTA
jgi:hypothetical protein